MEVLTSAKEVPTLESAQSVSVGTQEVFVAP